MNVIAATLAAALAVQTSPAIFGGRARARRREQEQEHLARLEQEAGSALVRTDERVRLAADELGFALAQLGERETQDLAAAVDHARDRLREAFHLHQLLHDHVPDTDAQRLEWFSRIVELCRAADTAVGEQAAALAARRAAAGRTPTAVAEVRADVERLQGQIPAAERTLADLVQRYTDAALQPVSANPEQARRLLEFAARSAGVATRKLEEARPRDAEAAAAAAAETVRRAEGLLEAVERFEMEALAAEATLGAMIAESREELATARALPAAARAGAVDDAVAALEQALAALPAPGERTDPIGSLTRVREANTALDDAMAARLEAQQRAQAVRAHLATALEDAERQLQTARRAIDDYRVPVGPQARTRLAEAERELAHARAERDDERALGHARRAATLAAEASTLAHRDIASQQHGHGHPGYGQGQPGYGGGWQGAPRGRARSGGDLLGGILGGMVLGGILDELGDLGDFLD
ncbi:hypothetical protein DNL40_14225 [Xylanimonas oleitrophica]|uniref:TPM domain-containing protein n=1 Tax=Xylanimonas oleitrophica TaxID=2607479 RepID=A0A2W5XQT3_9MICO|nr:hypothetical protein [Xylanimonas oleitrophica]PZR51968.1 hypothetical protein DNL40_14225 [Xylanimonas oleitrophica]